jgi:hypothetical protein
MSRRTYTATVERIATGTGATDAYREYLWLTDLVDEGDQPFAGEQWLNYSPTLQHLDLRPGDRIRFEARLDAGIPHRPPLGTSIDDPAAFLAEMAAQGIDTEGVIFRLVMPTQVSVKDSEPTRRTTSRSRADW